ncbi:MAG: hypothetical protein JWN32_4471 [Solirubrobacterales bacterium]|nr:hypothetical protein [Solirubrobacterales bacterium]
MRTVERTRSPILIFVRYVVPTLIVVGGIVAIVAGNAGMGIVLIGVGALVYGMNYYWRLSFSDVSDRDKEEAARAYYDEHGHWPDEPAK